MTSDDRTMDGQLESYLRAELADDAAWRELCEAAERQADSGAAHTPYEILQQPWLWETSATRVAAQLEHAGLLTKDASHIYLTGAGSSYYVGKCLEALLSSRLGKRVTALPTTDAILNPDYSFDPQAEGLVVSFSRSGASPESFEAARVVSERYPAYRQLLITCDGSSELAALFGRTPRCSVLDLPPASCDRGLAMTSSFSSMVLAGQGLVFPPDGTAYLSHVRSLAGIARQVLREAARLCQTDRIASVRRVCLLGNGALNGVAQEGGLKMLELTDGQVCTVAESFLGVRHGPLSFVDEGTLIVCFVSSNGTSRLYERDLMRELQTKGLGWRRVAIGFQLEELTAVGDEAIDLAGISSSSVADELRAPLDVLVPQVLALRMSLALGLNPDTPSRRGTINRVVQGVTIH